MQSRRRGTPAYNKAQAVPGHCPTLSEVARPMPMTSDGDEMNDRIKRGLIAALMGVGGLALIIYHTNIWVAVGVFLLMFAGNIDKMRD